MTQATPPKLMLRFFRWFCQPGLRDVVEGDLLELYNERKEKFGRAKADLRFIADVLLLLRTGIVKGFNQNNSLNQRDMLRNYFKIALRILVRNKGYSFINIAGLAIGLAAAMLIMLWVQNEVSYDRFHAKSDRIYKMFSRDNFNDRTEVWPATPSLMAPELKQSYGEVEDAARYRVVFFLMKVGENRFNEQGAFADPSFLTMFDFAMHDGKRNALANDFGIVLSEPMALKLFGKTNCVGESVIVNDNDSFTVTGVLKALPHNTEFKFDFLLPWNYMTRLGWDRFENWTQTSANIYTLLNETASPEVFQSKVEKIVQSHVPKGEGSTREVIAQPLTRAHLYSRAEGGELVRGRIEAVRLFSAIAALIVLIACINFMNLSTARSEKRAREVGVRKVVGAQKGSLIAQFITESILLVFIAFVIAVGMVQAVLGVFSMVVEAPLQINFTNPQYWLVAVLLIVGTGLLAGSYPAFFLSASQPLRVLKGTFKNVRAAVNPRKVLVVLQFTAAIVLSICAIMVQRQMEFAMNRDAGFNRAGIAYNFTQGEVPRHFEAIREELLTSGAAISVTRTFSPITYMWNSGTGYSWPGSTEEDKTSKIFVQFGSDRDFIKTFGATIAQGRDLDVETYPSDTAAMLLNEKAVEMMGLKDPIGAEIRNVNGEVFHVVGVIKNFIVESPYQEIGPMMMAGWTERYGVVNFRLNPDLSQAEALLKAETVFKKYNPEYPFEYSFADDYYNRKFGNEKKTALLAGLFAALTILISCLGLFGLAAYMAENRTKEIGIRKVLGASTVGITLLMSKEFVRLVVLSIIIASPIAIYIVDKWLQSFNYRVPLAVSVFVITAGTAVLIAVLTVSFQAVKAAMANPVNSLRSE